jgi:hypothetical protein
LNEALAGTAKLGVLFSLFLALGISIPFGFCA